MIAYGKIDYRSDDRKKQICRILDQAEVRISWHSAGKNCNSPLAGRFLDILRRNLTAGRKLKILDVGCGTGFFSILLAREGHEVTGIDLTSGMIRGAEILAGGRRINGRREGALPFSGHGRGKTGF